MIPFDQIYNYLLNLSKTKTVIYFLKTFRNRNLDDFVGLYQETEHQRRFRPVVVAHDQEMLEFDRYLDHKVQDQYCYNQQKDEVLLQNLNLRWLHVKNIHDRYILTHSELNSEQVEMYRSHGFEPVYFWSHALIARDWYRYAEYDPLVSTTVSEQLPLKDFLIYSRGWQGTREYRLKFAELVVQQGLEKHSIYRISHQEEGIRLKDYQISDLRFSVRDLKKIEDSINDCSVSGDASATYDPRDFRDTGISIVLETNFTDPRIHLTEKILRPIAMGHPFILGSSPGSLQYLRDYGFTTFSEAGIDESYDLETHPILRLEMIIKEMSRIQHMPREEKEKLYFSLRSIAIENRKKFFSQEFYDYLTTELKENYLKALQTVTSGTFGKLWLENRRLLRNQNGPDQILRGYQLKNLSVIRAKRLRNR